MGVASLVLGIIALCLSIFSGGSLGMVGIICAILGIVFGILGRRNPLKAGVATGGLVCSIIALLFGIILMVACVGCAAAMGI